MSFNNKSFIVFLLFVFTLFIQSFSQKKEKLLHFMKDVDPDVIWLSGSGMSPTVATVTLSATTEGGIDTMIIGGKPMDIMLLFPLSESGMDPTFFEGDSMRYLDASLIVLRRFMDTVGYSSLYKMYVPTWIWGTREFPCNRSPAGLTQIFDWKNFRSPEDIADDSLGLFITALNHNYGLDCRPHKLDTIDGKIYYADAATNVGHVVYMPD
ncbi:MAG: hypothetical protein ABIA63_12505, partial [bacterium]